ncbi:MAG: endonuclease/exonuclease/phosphatase family protein [Bacteroidota bacterium]
MPFYYDLKKEEKDVRIRAAKNLLSLRKELKLTMPSRKVNDSIIIGTWNIRDFGRNRFGFGERMSESYYYIAEIISKFDIIAIQEVDKDLSAIENLTEILGPSWNFFASTNTLSIASNNTRLVYLFDERKVIFQNIAGQVILDQKNLIQEKYQFARAPYIATFRSGSFKFSICSVHIYFGISQPGHIKYQRRLSEIDTIARLMAKKMATENENIILLGDFNIISPEHETMDMLLRHGFTVPKNLLIPSNVHGTKHYDQIAFLVRENELQIADSKKSSGVFNYFNTVFKINDIDHYSKTESWKNAVKKGKNDNKDRIFFYKMWRTFQMSDHFPKWIELKTDFSVRKLKLLKS